MKKYKSNKQIGWFFAFLGLLAFFVMAVPFTNYKMVIGGAYFLSTSWLVGLLIVKFTRAILRESTFSYVWGMIFRHRTDVFKISAIAYLPTWRLQEKFRSLWIYYEGKWSTTMELTDSTFDKVTLGEVVYDLKRLNPHIELDAHTEQLMQDYMKHANITE